MPQINVRADGPSEGVMLSERINVTDFESEHFRAQLVERLAWAVGDADAAEQAHRNERDGVTRKSARDDRRQPVRSRRSRPAASVRTGPA